MKALTTDPGQPRQPEVLQFDQPLRDVVITRVTTLVEDLKARHRIELESSFEKGRVEGERALGELLVQQRSELMAMKASVVDSLMACLPNVTRECENALVELALETARRLVAGMPVSEEMIRASIREAISQVQEATEYLVQLAPEDYEILSKLERDDTLPRTEGKLIRFEPSTLVTRGGCMVRTRFGTLDCRRETQFEALKEALNA